MDQNSKYADIGEEKLRTVFVSENYEQKIKSLKNSTLVFLQVYAFVTPLYANGQFIPRAALWQFVRYKPSRQVSRPLPRL